MAVIPAISVILPVFNGEAYLRQAIDSILNQSFIDFELIIVNDGSTDRSQEIIQSYGDTRIHAISNPSNLGLVGALNVGIKHARGKYIARQDQDDISDQDRLKLQFLKMEEDLVDICGTRWISIDSNGKALSTAQIPLSELAIFSCLATTVPFAHGSVMMRKSFMSEYHLQYDEKYLAEDFYLWIRFAQAGARFANLDQALYFYRAHPQSLSFTKRGAFRQSAKLLRRDFVRQNGEHCERVLDILTESDSVMKALNYREMIYAAILAYRLPLSTKTFNHFIKLFRRASLRLKLHILYTVLRS
jgi:glycosyltransferase involved in cell wall biosynthesis